ncbi:MAG TPA: cupin domain-containing protein [Microvirga sp.]|nr:cupin domain-containing protein [Microvirga sp.]
MMTRSIAALGLALAATVSWAQSSSTGGASDALPAGFETKPVIKTGKTRDGDPIAYPRTDKPELVSVIGTIQPGGRTPLHQHPIPTYVYVLEGEVELQTEGGQPHQYKTGEAYVESLNKKHQLFNRGSSPARVLVVFVGEEGKPTTVTPTQ